MLELGLPGGVGAIACHTRWELALWRWDATTARDAALRRQGGGKNLAFPFPHPLISCLLLAEFI